MCIRTTRSAIIAIALAVAPAAVLAEAPTAIAYPPLDVLLSSGLTVEGEAIVYPPGPARVTAAIVTMAPGQSTGPHLHEAPLLAYMLEGELTVTYASGAVRTYVAGEALLEAFESEHDGVNSGPGPARLLAVFMGADGVENTVPLPR